MNWKHDRSAIANTLLYVVPFKSTCASWVFICRRTSEWQQVPSGMNSTFVYSNRVMTTTVMLECIDMAENNASFRQRSSTCQGYVEAVSGVRVNGWVSAAIDGDTQAKCFTVSLFVKEMSAQQLFMRDLRNNKTLCTRY